MRHVVGFGLVWCFVEAANLAPVGDRHDDDCEQYVDGVDQGGAADQLDPTGVYVALFDYLLVDKVGYDV